MFSPIVFDFGELDPDSLILMESNFFFFVRMQAENSGIVINDLLKFPWFRAKRRHIGFAIFAGRSGRAPLVDVTTNSRIQVWQSQNA